MKRIAAMGALVISMLAVLAAAAMASTASPGTASSASGLPKACRAALLRFDVATGSSTLTEVSGPIPAPAQEFRYDGVTYTIMTVNPGADSFTVFRDGFLFVNKGAAIAGGTGLMGCSR